MLIRAFDSGDVKSSSSFWLKRKSSIKFGWTVFVGLNEKFLHFVRNNWTTKRYKDLNLTELTIQNTFVILNFNILIVKK